MECNWGEWVQKHEKLIIAVSDSLITLIVCVWVLVAPFRAFHVGALLGHRESQRLLAINYLVGSNGANQDYEKAKKWFKIAAMNGDVDAASWLSMMYRDGIGVERSFLGTTKWTFKHLDNILSEDNEWRKIKSEIKACWEEL